MSNRKLARRAEFRTWSRQSTRWRDNDAYGHVNNVVFYEWFDSAVNAWLVEQGLLDIAHGDPIALVVETRCTYSGSLAFPVEIDVGLAVEHLGTSSMRYRIGIFGAGSDEAAAEGHFVHVLVDRSTRRPVPLPERWRAALEGISA